MQFENGVLIPNSIKKEVMQSNDFFLKDLYEIAVDPRMVELSLSSVNTYKKGDEILSENFGIPYDDNDELLLSQKEAYEALGIPVGKHIQGNLGQTLIPNAVLPSGKMSTNNSIQIIINSNGS